MRKQEIVVLLCLAVLLFSKPTVAADTLRVEVDNGTVTIQSENLGENRFSCDYDSSYQFQLPDTVAELEKKALLNREEKDNVTLDLTFKYGGCEANLAECGLKLENEKTEKQTLTAAQESLKSCSKQAEVASYERLAFIGLFMLVLILAVALVRRGRK